MFNQSNHAMNALSNNEVFRWMLDRTMQGILNEEQGSIDSLEDADDFVWFCHVNEVDGKKCVDFSTSLNPFPFATGYMTKTGKPRIKWN